MILPSHIQVQFDIPTWTSSVTEKFESSKGPDRWHLSYSQLIVIRRIISGFSRSGRNVPFHAFFYMFVSEEWKMTNSKEHAASSCLDIEPTPHRSFRFVTLERYEERSDLGVFSDRPWGLHSIYTTGWLVTVVVGIQVYSLGNYSSIKFCHTCHCECSLPPC